MNEKNMPAETCPKCGTPLECPCCDGLHGEAVRRAQSYGVNVAKNGTALESTRRDKVSFFGEDLIVDVLDLTEASTFVLGELFSMAILFPLGGVGSCGHTLLHLFKIRSSSS